jgi:hypothetical protein
MRKLRFQIKRILKNSKTFVFIYRYLKVRFNHYESIKLNIQKFKEENTFILNDNSLVSDDDTIMVISQSDFKYSAIIELMLLIIL